MRAVAILVKENKLDFAHANEFFDHVTKSNMSRSQENTVFEHLLLAVHQLSALRALENVAKQSDIVRVASVGWYYGIYAAATAMVAAQEGTILDNHRKTANTWDRQLVQRKFILYPFDLRVSTLIKKDAEAEIDRLRQGLKFKLVSKPKTADDAHRAMCTYLSGTTEWMSRKIRENLKQCAEFKKLGVPNFQTKDAQELRDKRLSKDQVSFLHLAIRFRGKANYREAPYLAHGTHVESTISGFVSDMAAILEAFLAMAGAFAFKRLGADLTEDFIKDLDVNRSFSLDHRTIWS